MTAVEPAVDNFDYGHNSAFHFVQWDQATGEGRFICGGGALATCHQFPDCECEQWSEEHDAEHRRVAHSYCWIEPWLQSVPMEDSYSTFEPNLVKRDGRITTEWDGDCVLWQYAEEVAS